MPKSKWMIYGASGYTGELVAREAKRRGMSPILAGRNRQLLEALGRDLELPVRIIGLDDRDELRAALETVDLALHCAGPFVHTCRPMVEACLVTGTHYLDITGEIAVFEALLSLGKKAESAGVVLLPGVGFDVVPTDCLAASLAAALPDATHLELAFAANGGSASRGTLKTMIEAMPAAGAVRRDGKVIPVPLAYDAKEIDFSCGRLWAMTIPWGDVSTAFRSTGIPNIRVYTGMSPAAISRARRFRSLLPLAGLQPVKRFLKWRIDSRVTGPDAETRASARTFVWGRVYNTTDQQVTGTLETPEGYAFTALSSVECAHRVLQDQVQPGSWTPSAAFGPGLIGELAGVTVGELKPS